MHGIIRIAAVCAVAMLVVTSAVAQPSKNIPQVAMKVYPAGGLIWKGESRQNTNWNKICEDTRGCIWYSGGDHWGTDRSGGIYEDRYERPWGFGNTTVCFYDPKTDKAEVAYELDRAGAIYSNAETPGHGKIHANIQCDSKGRIWTAGYLGSSYNHEFTNAYYPKSYGGGSIICYDPATDDTDYYGVPVYHGGVVALYLDENHHNIYGLTVDRARFWSVNYETWEVRLYETNGRFGLREMLMDKNGFCYFANEYKGLTRFDPDTETFVDLPITIPGLRASCVSSDNMIYGISSEGFVWRFDPKKVEVEEYGHVVHVPEEGVYTPNVCIDEDLNRLYFIAGGHGVTLAGMPIVTVLDLKTKKFHWVGKINVDGCYGSVVGRDHSVYFSCYGYAQQNGRRLKNKDDKEYRTCYLVKYEPPKKLEDNR